MLNKVSKTKLTGTKLLDCLPYMHTFTSIYPDDDFQDIVNVHVNGLLFGKLYNVHCFQCK